MISLNTGYSWTSRWKDNAWLHLQSEYGTREPKHYEWSSEKEW